MKLAMLVVTNLVLPLVLAGCGSGLKDHTDSRSEDGDGGGIAAPGGGGTPHQEGSRPAEHEENDQAIVRGRWVYQVSNLDSPDNAASPSVFLAAKGSVNQPISGMVAAAVTYTVDNTNFRSGAIVDGPVSYG